MAMAAICSYRVAAVGVQGCAPKTEVRYQSPLFTLARFEGARAVQSPLNDTMSQLLASQVSLGQTVNRLRIGLSHAGC